MNILDKFNKLCEFGIPFPILRDPIRKSPSITYTMALVSFIIAELAKNSEATSIMTICLGLYLGRTITRKKDNKVEETKNEEK